LDLLLSEYKCRNPDLFAFRIFVEAFVVQPIEDFRRLQGVLLGERIEIPLLKEINNIQHLLEREKLNLRREIELKKILKIIFIIIRPVLTTSALKLTVR
jgi:hypothetical protein